MAFRDEILRTLPIKETDLVLEIGGGPIPFWRSDLQCDNDILESKERADALRCRTPLVCCDIASLPFRDGAFDCVVCSQVLEHVEDPVLACSELSRVAHRGYIETPSHLRELLLGWPFHKWIVEIQGESLVFAPNLLPQPFGRRIHELQQTCPEFLKFTEQRHEIMNVTQVWTDSISCRVESFPVNRYTPLSATTEGATKQWTNVSDANKLVRSEPTVSESMVKRVVSKILRRLDQRLRKDRHRSKLSQKELVSILCCPACKRDLRWESIAVYCDKCRLRYPLNRNIPDFIHSQGFE